MSQFVAMAQNSGFMSVCVSLLTCVDAPHVNISYSVVIMGYTSCTDVLLQAMITTIIHLSVYALHLCPDVDHKGCAGNGH